VFDIVSDAIDRYATDHSTPEDALLAELAAETRAAVKDPQMLVGHLEGNLLRAIAKMTGARCALEIGTFTGYSALALASGMPDDGRLVTCDVDPVATTVAKGYWARSPHGRKIELRLRPAMETLADWTEPLDLVFIDADKRNYVAYWDACVPRVRAGGVILADNVLWSGTVLDPQKPDDHAIVAFNRRVAADDRVESVMLTVRDALSHSIKR
jgi:caffeoyl-CoA O-methyltransferase